MAGERLKYWESTGFDELFRKAIEDIREHGVHLVCVLESEANRGWAYSVGLADTYGHPELIVVGRDAEAASSVINQLAGRIAAGQRIEVGVRMAGVADEVDVVARAIDPAWNKQLVPYALWFMGTAQVPVLQIVFPDRENRMPWEAGFDTQWRDQQPLLFAHGLDERVEQEFRAELG